MSFWTRAISAFTNRPMVDNSPVGMPTGGVQSYISSYSDTGRYISPEEARAAPTVHACVNLISQSIARMEWRILSNYSGIDQAVRGHPLYALLNRAPASYMGAMTWRQSMLIDCLLYGNAYSFIERDASGRVIALHKLRPDLMEVQRVNREVVYRYSGSADGQITSPAYDIFHLIGSSADGLLGDSAINLCRQIIGVELESEAYVANFFRNGARPAGVLEVTGVLTPEAFSRLKDSWTATQGGSRNAGRVAILESGYKFTPISVDPDDAQLIELRRYCREQISAAFGVPSRMVGDASGASYASAEQSDIEFTKHTLGAWAARLEEEVALKLIPAGEAITSKISFDELVRGDLSGRFSAYSTALNLGFMSINEVRAKEGAAPVAGGDVCRTPMNFAPISDPARDGAPQGAEAVALGVGQLQAITMLAKDVAAGAVSVDSAVAMLLASFPLMLETTARLIFAGAVITLPVASSNIRAAAVVPALVLVRGLPGSGKSTYAASIACPGALIEADHFFYKDGEYKFNRYKLRAAHADCIARTRLALESGEFATVAVANTFTTLSELLVYTKMAESLGIACRVVNTRYKFKSIHGVPADTLEKMAARWEAMEGETFIPEGKK